MHTKDNKQCIIVQQHKKNCKIYFNSIKMLIERESMNFFERTSNFPDIIRLNYV